MKEKSLTTSPATLVALATGDIQNALVAATPGGIEEQEAQGQRDLVKSQSLPIEKHGGNQGQFEELGFIFGDEIDDLFVECKLPDGWEYKATGHSMHSDIIDAEGRTRVSIFYKAAFYDRKAGARLISRFRIDTDYEKSEPGEYPLGLFDQSVRIKLFGMYDTYDEEKELKGKAEAWMKEHYPDWLNPLAYWDT